MRAQKLMTLDVHTTPADLSIEQAHQLMLGLGIRHLPVVVQGKLVGMVSDRDILLSIGRSREEKFLYPQMSVGEIMTSLPRVAGADTPVADLAKIMVEEKIDAVPICSTDDTLLGLVTSSDLLLLLTGLPPDSYPTLSYQVRQVKKSPLQA